MALKPPTPNLEHPPAGELSDRDHRLLAERVQQLQDFLCQQPTNKPGENSVGAAQIKAEAVGLSELSTAAEQNFLQLASAATRKAAFGSSTATFEKEKDFSNAVKITHGLGATPVYADGIAVTASGSGTVISPKLVSGSLGSTTFEIYFASDATFGAKTEVEFKWYAIG